MTELIIISIILGICVIILYVLLSRANNRVDQSIGINFRLVSTNGELETIVKESNALTLKAVDDLRKLANETFGTNSGYSNIAALHGLKYWPLKMKDGYTEVIIGLKDWELDKARHDGWVFKTTNTEPSKVFKYVTESLIDEGMENIKKVLLKKAEEQMNKELSEATQFGRKSEKAVIDKFTESASEKSEEWEKEGTPVDEVTEKPPYRYLHSKDLKWQNDGISLWTRLIGDGCIISIYLTSVPEVMTNGEWKSLVLVDGKQIHNKIFTNKTIAKRQAIVAMNKYLKKLYDTGK